MMKIVERCLALVLLVLLVMPLALTSYPVHARIEYADTYVNAATGSDDNAGNSPTSPVKTIATAINCTAGSGTIHVAAGTYNEHNLDLNNTMNLAGAGALTTIIDGNSQGLVLKISSAPFQQNTISGLTIRGGAPNGPYCGGGIYISSSHIVTINDCTITGNYRGTGLDPYEGLGGGICNDQGKVYMNRCTISGNGADEAGGGIANICASSGTEFGKMWLTNCTISGNRVTDSMGVGGGLYNSADADVTLLNVTIFDNHAAGGKGAGGGFSNSSLSSMYFKNCIVANNTAGFSQWGNGYNGLGSGVHSQGNNLDSQNSCFFDQPTDQINTDPQLGHLQNNGGPTSTCAITRSSPAYNRGDVSVAPATDQRGIPRPAGICSIGAYEPAVTSGSVNSYLGPVGFSIDAGVLSGLTAISNANVSCAPAGYVFPYGFFSFNITNLAPGQSVHVTLTFPSSLPSDMKYFKCLNGSTVDCSSFMTIINPTTLQLTLTDGGNGDSDRLANGTIVDPGAPAFVVAGRPVRGQSSMTTGPQGPVSLPSISVKSASLSASKVGPGTPVTVTASVANTGAVNGTGTIKVYVNGQEEASQGITVSSGGNTPITFTVSRNEPGTYSVYVGGTNAGSFTVDALADPNIILYISGALILFAFAIGVIYTTGRRSQHRQ
jgi:Right handed beta helix region